MLIQPLPRKLVPRLALPITYITLRMPVIHLMRRSVMYVLYGPFIQVTEIALANVN